MYRIEQNPFYFQLGEIYNICIIIIQKKNTKTLQIIINLKQKRNEITSVPVDTLDSTVSTLVTFLLFIVSKRLDDRANFSHSKPIVRFTVSLKIYRTGGKQKFIFF